MPDVELRIEEGDTLLIDGEAFRVQSPERERAFAGADPDEWQLSVPGGMTDVTKSPTEFRQMLAGAENVTVAR